MRTWFPNIGGYVLIQGRLIIIIFIIIIIIIIVVIIIVIINTLGKRKEVGVVFKTNAHCSKSEKGIHDRTVETRHVLICYLLNINLILSVAASKITRVYLLSVRLHNICPSVVDIPSCFINFKALSILWICKE